MMHCLAYISFAFLMFQLFNVLLNLIFRQKIAQSGTLQHEEISILIPARNEEDNIGSLLSDLKKIKNEKIEIIVFDDQSTDNTAKIVSEKAVLDKRVSLLYSEELPLDWLGKNHACYKLAQCANGSHFLFIDADVRIKSGIIEDAVEFLKNKNLGLLSVFPVQEQKSIGEKITVPIMNYILLTLLPLILVRISPFTSHSAANGQFMLFKASLYRTIQPHKRFKLSPVEDIAISRYYKKKKIKIACLVGENRIQCRMYKSYREALDGFAKNIFMFFGNQSILAFLFWAFAALGFIPVMFLGKIYLLCYLVSVIMVQLLYSLLSRQNILSAILLFPLQLLFLLQLMIRSLYLKTRKQYTWKNRNIYS